MFRYLDLETVSECNRRCVTCLRNSHPNRDAVKTFFEHHLLPMDIIQEALDQVNELGFAGGVCLSHYNEPLMDKRLPEIARMVKSYGKFFLFFNTNGDFLTEELAKELDGILNRIIITLYMNEPIKSKRKAWIESLFHKTEAQVNTFSEHIPTHFSPKFDVAGLAHKHINHPCTEPQTRVIINHRQQYLLCCDDVVGNFDLGTFPETSIEDFWYGDKRMKIVLDLENAGGRMKHPYCMSCPRP